jgi:hypothetical protein
VNRKESQRAKSQSRRDYFVVMACLIKPSVAAGALTQEFSEEAGKDGN